MQNQQTRLISPVEALTQQVASSFPTTPSALADEVVGATSDSALYSEMATKSTITTTTSAPAQDTVEIGNTLVDFDVASFDNINNKDASKQRASIFLHRQGFRLNNYNLMVRFEDGNQISEIPNIYPLPNAPKWFLGMSNINGQTIPVFNLKEYFGITNYDQDSQRIKVNKITTDKKTPMLFVIQQGDNATGIIIDGLLERLDIDDSKIQPNINLPNKLKNCTHHTYLLNKELWYDLNCLDFLDEIEKQIAS